VRPKASGAGLVCRTDQYFQDSHPVRVPVCSKDLLTINSRKSRRPGYPLGAC